MTETKLTEKQYMKMVIEKTDKLSKENAYSYLRGAIAAGGNDKTTEKLRKLLNEIIR